MVLIAAIFTVDNLQTQLLSGHIIANDYPPELK